jgi:hypothetical protein
MLRNSRTFLLHIVHGCFPDFAVELLSGRWFSPVSSTNKTDRRDITVKIVESDVKQQNPAPFLSKVSHTLLVVHFFLFPYCQLVYIVLLNMYLFSYLFLTKYHDFLTLRKPSFHF